MSYLPYLVTSLREYDGVLKITGETFSNPLKEHQKSDQRYLHPA